jgi:uncharacterized membrane protein YqjE
MGNRATVQRVYKRLPDRPLALLGVCLASCVAIPLGVLSSILSLPLRMLAAWCAWDGERLKAHKAKLDAANRQAELRDAISGRGSRVEVPPGWPVGHEGQHPTGREGYSVLAMFLDAFVLAALMLLTGIAAGQIDTQCGRVAGLFTVAVGFAYAIGFVAYRIKRARRNGGGA